MTFIVWITFILLQQKTNVTLKKKYENKDFRNVVIPSEDTKILEFIQYQKSDKVLFIIYEVLEYLIEKIDGCKNAPENSSTTNAGKYILSGFSMSTILSFKSVENRHDV